MSINIEAGRKNLRWHIIQKLAVVFYTTLVYSAEPHSCSFANHELDHRPSYDINTYTTKCRFNECSIYVQKRNKRVKIIEMSENIYREKKINQCSKMKEILKDHYKNKAER